MRRLVAETRLHSAELVLPMFVREGASDPVAISSMPGVQQHSLDSFRRALATTPPSCGIATWRSRRRSRDHNFSVSRG